MKIKYKVLQESKDDVLQTKIEKSNFAVDFTMDKVKEHLESLDKAKKELEGNIKVHEIKVNNIEEHHEFLNEMSDEEISVAYQYHEAKAMVSGYGDKLEKVEEAIKAYGEEIKEIEKQTKLKFNI